jgi:hypothetical protein
MSRLNLIKKHLSIKETSLNRLKFSPACTLGVTARRASSRQRMPPARLRHARYNQILSSHTGEMR